VPEYRVSSEMITNVASQVTSGASEIEGQRSALLAQIQGLGDSWQGTAASALQELYAKWDSDARALMETLTEIGQAMQEAATAYEVTEEDVTREFS
jgi:WXG100 family type VII secretion target